MDSKNRDPDKGEFDTEKGDREPLKEEQDPGREDDQASEKRDPEHSDKGSHADEKEGDEEEEKKPDEEEEEEESDVESEPPPEEEPFRLLTPESLVKLRRRNQRNRRIREKLKKQRKENGMDDDLEEVKKEGINCSTRSLEQGKSLPPRLVDLFPMDLVGKPLEDIDPYYYNNQYVSTQRNLLLFSSHVFATDTVDYK